MQPSRRAFLMGGRRAGGEWGRFYQRLARLVSGKLEDRSPGSEGRSVAWLRPVRAVDIHHARALCAELGVTLVLEGSAVRVDGPQLLIDVTALNALQASAGGVWRAEPGVRVGTLRQHVPHAHFPVADDTTLAEWLTGPAAARASLDSLAASGLSTVEVLLADGATEAFGPFGAESRRAALSPAVSGLVSAMFMLARTPEASRGHEPAGWPGRYRLDALLTAAPNLAWLLAGSAGTLAWAETWIFAAPLAVPETAVATATLVRTAGAADAQLDAAVKRRFDPAGVYAHLPSPVV